MQTLLRNLRRGTDGIPELQDTEIAGEAISIGAAPDCHIQLLGADIAPRHATLRQAGTVTSLVCRRGCRVVVGGRSVASAKLTHGDVVEIGTHRLTIAAPPAGFDLAVEIEAGADVPTSEFERAFRTDLQQTWLSRRRASWLLAVLVPILAFAVPLGVVFLERGEGHAPRWLPRDSFWSTGELVPAHAQTAGDDCRVCHRQLFRHVQDGDCRECHELIGDHIAAAHADLRGLGPTQRCAQCHREHDASGGSLTVMSDALCTGCHADPQVDFRAVGLAAVARFHAGDHPAFKATLLRPKGPAGPGTVPEWQSLRTAVAGATETTNLSFSHQQHLDVEKVQRQSDGQPLGCGDCHRAEPGGEHFAPVSMAGVCSGCHELSFDEDAPRRQLPHGRPQDAILMMQDYFTRRYTDPAAREEQFVRRRRPDRQPAAAECTDTPIVCARQRAAREIDTQFTRRGCVSCHAVDDTRAADIRERYFVRPVRLVHDYFTNTRFNHRAHSIHGDLRGDDACAACHRARDSRSSEDLLLPDLDDCLECHSDRPALDRVALGCTSCHSFHPARILSLNK